MECMISKSNDNALFVIAGINKVLVSIISLGLWLQLITLTLALIIPDISKPHPIIIVTKTTSKMLFVLHLRLF